MHATPSVDRLFWLAGVPTSSVLCGQSRLVRHILVLNSCLGNPGSLNCCPSVPTACLIYVACAHQAAQVVLFLLPGWHQTARPACFLAALTGGSRPHKPCRLTAKLLLQVPIQRMPAARPAPAPAHQLPAGPQQPSQQPSQQSGLHHNSGSKAQTAQPQRSRKRAKQAAGAGTALLALFSFVVFLGPLGPLQGFSPAAQQQQMHTGMTETPGGALHSSGRVLMSLPSGLEHTPAGFNNSQQQQMNTVSRSEHLPARPNDTQLQLPHSSGVAKQGNPAFIEGTGENDVALPVQNGAEVALHGQAWWLHGANSSYDDSRSIMLRPSDKVAEQQALQGLKVWLAQSNCCAACWLSILGSKTCANYTLLIASMHVNCCRQQVLREGMRHACPLFLLSIWQDLPNFTAAQREAPRLCFINALFTSLLLHRQPCTCCKHYMTAAYISVPSCIMLVLSCYRIWRHMRCTIHTGIKHWTQISHE